MKERVIGANDVIPENGRKCSQKHFISVQNFIPTINGVECLLEIQKLGIRFRKKPKNFF